ncbi:MAG: ABC transporter ATP-binding protein [Planctomycetota bacterium]|nr:MAG: ABC transporter ATP-binding protein [Planctomycetota bacterium]
MGGLERLIPFVWRYRRRVALSVACALVVAAFWAINLSFTFLIVKVLLQGQDLRQYVQGQIAAAESAIDVHSRQLDRVSAALEELERRGGGSALESDAAYDLLREQARQQRKLAEATRKAYVLNAVDRWVLQRLPDDQFDVYAVILAALFVCTCLKGACLYLQDVIVGSVVHLVSLSIRREFFRRLLRLDYHTVTSECGHSEFISRFTNDLTELQAGLTLLGGKVVREPLKAAACVVFAFYINWRLTLLAVLFVPVIGGVFYRFGRAMKRANRRTLEAMASLCQVLAETLRGFKVITVFQQQRQHRLKFHRENRKVFVESMGVVQVDSATSPTTELMGMIAVFLAVLPGAYLVLRQTTEIWNIQLAAHVMDIAQLSTMYALLAGVLDPVRKMSSLYTRLKRCSAAIERVFAVIDRQPSIVDPPRPLPVPRPIREIHFDNVTFQYRAADPTQQRPPVLRDVNLRIRAGEVVAVIGENGSGKSTLLNLVPRLYDPDLGAVRIDGTDIRRFRLRDLRTRIGLVTQEVILFDDTIANNVRYAKPDATDAEVREALRKVHLLDFVESLPEGIHSSLGKHADALSGGQRQRLTLARALLPDPEILILDECTAAVDAKGEEEIFRTLRDVVPGRTCLMVTHSITPAVLTLAERIVVMSEGRVIADGDHRTLIDDCPTYRRLYHAHRRSDEHVAPPATVADAASVPEPHGTADTWRGGAGNGESAASGAAAGRTAAASADERAAGAADSGRTAADDGVIPFRRGIDPSGADERPPMRRAEP